MNLSTGFVKELAKGVGWHQNLAGGRLELRTGSMPSDADAAVSGTLLATITRTGGTITHETRAEWKITLAGSSGSVNSIAIGGIAILAAAVNFTTDLSTTAAAVAAAINNTRTAPDFDARSDGADVYVKAPISSGTAFNAIVCAATATSMSATVAGDGTPNGSGGTVGVAAANALNWAFPPVAGVLSKESGVVWQDSLANASGTIGYARLVLDGADDGSSSTLYRRVDFSVGTSGADINGAVLTTTINTPVILNTFTVTIPKTA